MTAQEFFYWLQGFIELRTAEGHTASITPKVAEYILRHIDLVPARERGEGLIEVRTLVRLAARAQSSDDTLSLSSEIAKAVAGVFEHVIDPKAGGAAEQAMLNQAHHGNGHFVARC